MSDYLAWLLYFVLTGWLLVEFGKVIEGILVRKKPRGPFDGY